MSSKTFLTISKNECLFVYKQILSNSDAKWKSGINLGALGDYGGATSIAIISIEELIKALIVFFDGKGFELRRVKGMDVLFKQHQIRYVIAYTMFVMSLFGDELIKFIMEYREKPQALIAFMEEMKSDKDIFERKMKFYLFRKIIVLRKEFEWFSKADLFRQDGFYCDYDEQLKNPIAISLDDYQIVFQRLEKVRIFGKGIIDAFNSNEEIYNEQIERFRQDFRQKDYYTKIAYSLATLRQTKMSPFDLFKESFIKI